MATQSMHIHYNGSAHFIATARHDSLYYEYFDSVWGADGNPAAPNMEILKQMKLSYGLKTGGDFSFFLLFIEMFTNEILFASEVTRFNSRSVARIIVYSIALQTFVFSPKEKMYFFSKYRDIPIIFIMIFELSKIMLVGDDKWRFNVC